MSVAIGDVFLLTLEGDCNDQKIMLTHTYEVTALTGSTDEGVVSEDLAERVSTAGADILETPYLNCMASNYTLLGIHAQKIWPERYRRYTLPRSVAGNIANPALTSNVNAVISLHTTLAGRSQVSNKHVGPAPATAGWFTSGEITVGYKAVLDVLRTALLNAVGAAGWYTMTPCIFHRADVIPKSDYLSAGSVMNTVRVMRRRTVGVGI